MNAFDEVRKVEAEMLDVLREIEEEEAQLRADAQSVGENMRNARLLASRQACEAPRRTASRDRPRPFSESTGTFPKL